MNKRITLTGNMVEIPIENNYNGWTNRETWLVNLWLNNDLDSYNYRMESIKDIHTDISEVEIALENMVLDIYKLANNLKRFSKSNDDAYTSNGLVNDLPEDSLNKVNWNELALHYIEEIKEVTK